MKKTKILYWVFTGLFAAFMVFSSIGDVLMLPEAITFMNHLGYPNYFLPFIGVAKLLGCVAILVPGFPKIREWAYAGLTFDLIGALYSIVSVEGFKPEALFMAFPFILLILSYRYNQLKSQRTKKEMPQPLRVEALKLVRKPINKLT